MPFLGKTPTKLLDANVNIDGGNIDGTTIGASSTAPATVSTFTSTGIDDNAASTAITIDSSQDVTFTSDAKFPDNGKAIFGAGSDLEIYHNGSNSIIKDNGTGNLLIQGATDIVLEDTSGANYFRGVSGSYVRLYHNNSTKLETTATGIEVDGTDGATAIGIRGSSTTNNTLGGLIGFGDSANALVSFIGGGRAESNDDGFLSFRTTIAGVTSEAMHIDRSGNVGIGSPAASGINAPLDVDKAPVFNNVVANFGEFIALSGYQRGVVNINGRVNGTDYDAGLSFVRRNAGNSNWLNSIIAQDDGGHLYFGTGGSANSASTERMRIDSSGNVGIGTNSPQATIQVKNTSDNATLSSVSSSLTLNHQSGTYTNNNYYNVLGFSKANSNGTTLGASIAPVMDGIGQTSALTFGVANGGGSVAEAMRIDSGGNVGIGETNPSEKLDVSGNVKLTGQFFQSMPADFWSQGTTFIEINGMGNLTHQGSYETCLTSNGYRDNNNQWKSYAINNYTGAAQIKLNPQGHISFHTDSNKADGSSTTPTERMRIDSSGNVGIGTTSTSGVQGLLHIHSSSDDNGDGDGQVNFGDESTVIISTNATSAGSQGYYGSLFFGGQDVSSATQQVWKLAGISAYSSADLATTGSADLLFYTTNSASTPSERMRITSSGNLLVGKDVANSSVAGVQLLPEGDVGVTRDGSHALLLNRLTSDGDIALFRKDGTTVGSIGTSGGTTYIGGYQNAGLYFNGTTDFRPWNTSTQANLDNSVDLGSSSARFDDIYATNGTIQTSDANEKQDIEALSEAETRVAVAAKGLLRKFRWRSAVEEKGDEARVHFGIIAQDLQAAFEAEGLDAGDYAMFIHSTWTDEETGEERSRMGVRYSELLAFIIAAI